MAHEDLEIQWLRTFLTVIQKGSMTAASEQLCRSQSAISMHIRKLEENLAVRLFNRDTKKLSLTAAGHELLGYAEKLLLLHSQAKSAIKGSELRGRVSFGIPDDYASAYLPEILKSFSWHYPAVELNLICEPSSLLLPKIDAGTLDVAIVTRDASGRGHFLTREPLVWVGYFPEGAFRDAPLPVAMYEFGSEARKKVTSRLEQVKQGYRVMYNSPYIAGQIAVARSGLALAILTQCCVPDGMKIINSDELPELPVLDIAVVKGSHCTVDHPATYLTNIVIEMFG
ncbi:LysR family transcriptional regulator [Klebsiella quasipneumoniae]|uniref:LysR family transcriptional regulator n=1 Tax=Klebsiella quasipneumoniae TaxID=1463165 RepID=UPI000B42301B|nr:LysR family transcriptional regulator [Klebsiella quasipneumoniae]MCD7087517.1 LysR family transcriptional regulator [Klebsiella quasipneumoniae subsp. quasipneumoniae]MDD7843453.1 LysR family transcriptional regulator [Klebsiella quasipneumoniae]MDD7861172.1 LysR family transcriptional regulator [Klebsiella quasipneumoniae]MDF8308440.1 LysR family transcriptional regulator [Klebsiella quasipneumoniae]MDJ1029623.1 LysR family transcriptional regulator [Klebsiella quasipneumoniae]